MIYNIFPLLKTIVQLYNLIPLFLYIYTFRMSQRATVFPFDDMVNMKLMLFFSKDKIQQVE